MPKADPRALRPPFSARLRARGEADYDTILVNAFMSLAKYPVLADHVSSDAVARARLKQGLVEMRAGLALAQQTQDRKALILVLCIFGLAAAVTTGALLVH